MSTLKFKIGDIVEYSTDVRRGLFEIHKTNITHPRPYYIVSTGQGDWTKGDSGWIEERNLRAISGYNE